MRRSDDIACPGKLFVPEDMGGVVSYNGPQSSGKTIEMLHKTLVLLEGGWVQIFSDKLQFIEPGTYSPERVFSNRWLDIKGINYMSNDELKDVLYRAYGKTSRELGKWTRCIFLVFEADSLYSHLESIDRKVSEKLLNVSQSMCYGNWLMIEYHEGTGVLALLRQKREIICEPTFYREENIIHNDIYNGQTEQGYQEELRNVSDYFDLYRRHDGTI